MAALRPAGPCKKRRGPALFARFRAAHLRQTARRVKRWKYPFSTCGLAPGAEKSARKEKGKRRPILTLEDYTFSLYDQLLKAGLRMRDIDEMDTLGFLRVRAWSAGAGWTGKPDGKVHIDDVL